MQRQVKELAMRINLTTTLVAAALTGVMVANSAQALPIDNSNVSGNFGSTAAISVDTGALSTATVITFGGTVIGNFGLPATYAPLGGSLAPNTFLTPGGNVLTDTTAVGGITTLNIAGIGPNLTPDVINDFFTFTGSANTYEFDVTGLAVVTQASGALTVDVIGVLVDDSGTYATTSAGASLTFTQTGDSGSISGGFTLGSPPNFVPPPSVPEPMSLSLLGAGLTFLGVIRRKNKPN
jgi:hypothetical protein